MSIFVPLKVKITRNFILIFRFFLICVTLVLIPQLVIGQPLCGNVNNDEKINVGDPVYLVYHLFRGGQGIDPMLWGDVNHDGLINMADIVYLVNYIFKSGPAPGESSSNWIVTQDGSTVRIAYGSDISYPQYASLDTAGSYFRMVSGTESGWGTSIVLMPTFWEGGKLLQGGTVVYSYQEICNDLVLSFSGDISTLQVEGEIIIAPPRGDSSVASVKITVTGSVEPDIRPWETFKPLMLSSMRVSPDSFDASVSYVEDAQFTIPDDSWMISPPDRGCKFGLIGGSCVWKQNAPTIEIILEDSLPVTGWVTPSNDPNDDNIGFWPASDTVLYTWRYRIIAKQTL
ncbi:MAG: dockerin type I repeat-containing protein [candidate division Zixibacteria bacterium]